MTAWRTPWEDGPAPAEAPLPGPTPAPKPKPRGRRWALPDAGTAREHPAWLHHHLTITGPAGAVEGFAAAARGSGVVPWQLDGGALEEDVFNLAAAQPPAQRRLSIEGCRILARQVRDRVEARQARAAALVGRSLAETRSVCGWACPFDLHALLPVPDAVLQLGPNHPQAAAWLRENWGTADKPRHVAGRPDARPGRRLPRDHAVLGYGFFTSGDTPRAVVTHLAARWPGWTRCRQRRAGSTNWGNPNPNPSPRRPARRSWCRRTPPSAPWPTCAASPKREAFAAGTVALNKGSNVHYLLVQALASAGLKPADIRPAYLAPADARAAFERRAVDAWAIWDPFLSAAQEATGARTLADGQGLAPNRQFFLAARSFAEAQPDLLRLLNAQIDAIDRWAEANPAETTRLLAASMSLPEPVVARAVGRMGYGVGPLTPEVTADQQRIADTFFALKLIPQRLDVAGAVWKPRA